MDPILASMTQESFGITQYSADGIFMLNCSIAGEALYSLCIFGCHGEKIWERTDLCFSGSRELPIDLRSFSKGIYVMIISGRRKTWIWKLVRD